MASRTISVNIEGDSINSCDMGYLSLRNGSGTDALEKQGSMGRDAEILPVANK